MNARWSDSKVVWLIAGTLMGMGIAFYWPAEPAFAQAVEGNDKFAMCTVPTLVGSGDAVFVLDIVTGRLLGAGYSPQAKGFNQIWGKSVALDFGVADNAQYVMVPGRINITTSSGGGGSPAQGVIYVGEMTTGTICAYGFRYIQSTQAVRGELLLLAKFPFRQAVQ